MALLNFTKQLTKEIGTLYSIKQIKPNLGENSYQNEVSIIVSWLFDTCFNQVATGWSQKGEVLVQVVIFAILETRVECFIEQVVSQLIANKTTTFDNYAK